MSPMSSSLWFDAGSVSAAPELIDHSECERRTETAEVAALEAPPLALYLLICAKAAPSVEKGDLVRWSSRWAKTTALTSL